MINRQAKMLKEILNIFLMIDLRMAFHMFFILKHYLNAYTPYGKNDDKNIRRISRKQKHQEEMKREIKRKIQKEAYPFGTRRVHQSFFFAHHHCVEHLVSHPLPIPWQERMLCILFLIHLFIAS